MKSTREKCSDPLVAMEETKKFAVGTMPFALLCRQLDKIAAKPRLQKEEVVSLFPFFFFGLTDHV